jgi:hypothetical protein
MYFETERSAVMVRYIRSSDCFLDSLRDFLESVDSDPIVLAGGKLRNAVDFICDAYGKQKYETTYSFTGSHEPLPKELKHPLAEHFLVHTLIGHPNINESPRPVVGAEALLVLSSIDLAEHPDLVVAISKRNGVVILEKRNNQ